MIKNIRSQSDYIKRCTHLIFIDIFSQFGLSELVEGDDDQGDEDVDEEEGEDDEVDDVEDRHFSSITWNSKNQNFLKI